MTALKKQSMGDMIKSKQLLFNQYLFLMSCLREMNNYLYGHLAMVNVAFSFQFFLLICFFLRHVLLDFIRYRMSCQESSPPDPLQTDQPIDGYITYQFKFAAWSK